MVRGRGLTCKVVRSSKVLRYLLTCSGARERGLTCKVVRSSKVLRYGLACKVIRNDAKKWIHMKNSVIESWASFKVIRSIIKVLINL